MPSPTLSYSIGNTEKVEEMITYDELNTNGAKVL